MLCTDLITSFMLENGHVRGRVVRLSAVADTILQRHAYPDVVSRLLAEVLVFSAMLGSNLKQEGIFTVQMRGNGPVALLVVDASFGGVMRGYADIVDASSIAALAKASPQALLGEESYLAITLDAGEGMQRYQGVVGLEGKSFAEALENYFTHSQQIEMRCIAVASRRENGAWQAAGMMIERIAGEGGISLGEDADEAWRYAQAMMRTLRENELLDETLAHEVLLHNLFHEGGVIAYPAQSLFVGCRCSREKIEALLMSMALDDRAEMVVDGKVAVHCQFCNTTQEFTPAEVGLSVN